MSDSPTEVLQGVKEIINRHFFSDEKIARGYKYFHKRTCNALSTNPPKSFNGAALFAAIYGRIESNLANRPKERRAPSAQNWRLRSTDDPELIRPSSENTSAEVKLERAIVQKWPESWTYQMPVASGLFDGRSDKRRAVDLVFDHRDGHYDLVELKIKSDTPLYAAMEILGYGLVYLASRFDSANNLGYERADLPVLRAGGISLCVLAPEDYYQAVKLRWLEDGINEGLQTHATPDLMIDFRFEQFDFPWTRESTYRNLPESFMRQPVFK